MLDAISRRRQWASKTYGLAPTYQPAASRLSQRSVRVRLTLAVISCVLPVLWAWQVLLVWNIPDDDLQDPWGDALTYLAAGERLNDSHLLYAWTSGDRPVFMMERFIAPLISPPPIAAIWRPLAAVPFGLPIWVGACWVAPARDDCLPGATPGIAGSSGRLRAFLADR